MIVVDTSVFIDHLNGILTPQSRWLRISIAMETDGIAVGDLVLSEILQGLASDRDVARVERLLAGFHLVPMVGTAIARQSAANYRRLRARGITVRKIVDMLIGTFCIENRLPLLHADRDFEPMEQYLGLRTVAV